MCGIIAYTGKAELPVKAFLEAMGVMEIFEEEADRDALGGHGAGVLFIPKEGNVILEKVGHNGEDGDRPALRLRDKLEGKGLLDVSSRIILAHVRRAARQNEHRTKDKRYSQPYLTECVNGKKIAAIHNGYVANYKELAENFVLPHSLESEDDADDFIIDSEILPHLYEELAARGENPLKMGELTGFNRDGGNTFFILDVDRQKSYLFHQGKTRGLLLFRGPGGFLLSSRRKPVEKILEMADLSRKAEIQIPPRSPFSLAIELPLMESWL